MRWSILILPLVLGQCVRSSVPAALTPVRDESFAIRAIPVELYAGEPDRRSLGALEFLGGWQLVGNGSWFGGMSSLSASGRHLTAVTDAGGVISFDVGRFGNISGARVMPLPKGCGSGDNKADRDSEALAHDPATGTWWIGYEWHNAICRVSGDFTIGVRLAKPDAMARWPRTGGVETLLRLSNGRFLAIAERTPGGGAVRPVLHFDRDPTDPDARVATLGYRPPEGFSPTDAAELPDGRILVLNRRFSLGALFTVTVTVIDPAGISPGATLSGPVIARFESPALTENYEGIAVTVEDGRAMVWIVSDNNYASWQRTLLLKFALK